MIKVEKWQSKHQIKKYVQLMNFMNIKWDIYKEFKKKENNYKNNKMKILKLNYQVQNLLRKHKNWHQNIVNNHLLKDYMIINLKLWQYRIPLWIIHLNHKFLKNQKNWKEKNLFKIFYIMMLKIDLNKKNKQKQWFHNLLFNQLIKVNLGLFKDLLKNFIIN